MPIQLLVVTVDHYHDKRQRPAPQLQREIIILRQMTPTVWRFEANRWRGELGGVANVIGTGCGARAASLLADVRISATSSSRHLLEQWGHNPPPDGRRRRLRYRESTCRC